MKNIYQLLIGSGLTTGAIIIFIYLKPKIFEHWMAIIDKMFYKLLSFSLLLKNYFDQRAVASSIKDTVNSICEGINYEAPDALPHALQIEWVKSNSKKSFINNGKVVVRLKRFENQDKNIVNATLLYLKVGLLPISKNYLDDSLCKSCELLIASKIFIADRYSGAFDYFRSNILNPIIKKDALVKNSLQVLNDIDYVGFFTNVFLSEVKYMGDKLLNTLRTDVIEKEINKFAKFLQVIAKKSEQEDVPLTFKGSLIKVAIVLVARQETIQTFGIEPYITAVSRNIKDGCNSIYIGAWGKELIKRVIEIKNELKYSVVTILRIYRNYIKGNIEGIIVVCQPNYSFLMKQKQISNEFAKVMNEVIPLIKRNIIKIEVIAIIRKIGCKVAIRWNVNDRKDNYHAVGLCIEKDSEYINILHNKYENEFIHFIPWSPNKKYLLLNALFPLKSNQIAGIELDEVITQGN